MRRLLIPGLFLVGLAVFFGIDSWGKFGWPHVRGTVVSAEPSCEMSSVQYNLLRRTTTTATVDCDHVEQFKILHPDQEWKVKRSYLTQVRVAGARPVATTLVIYSEPQPAPAQVLDLIQDPKDELRVLKGNAAAAGLEVSGFTLALGLLISIGALALGRLRRSRKGPPKGGASGVGGGVQSTVPTRAAAFMVRPPASNASGRTFGRR